ncbi:MAG: SpoIIE family protein phosphatase [Candidatus Eremiobacteraeota bacterium]|nr:SpoIIE family protein phosphatase [Candidatus Eremiobacteraeota bacterium]
MLDLLLGAGRTLTRSESLGDALLHVAGAVASNLADYCEIECAPNAGDDLRVTAGTLPSHCVKTGSITQRINDGRRSFGTLRCATGSSDGFSDVARKAVKILATQLGVVLAGHALTQREHRVADRLQRALLPEKLPAIDGTQFFAAYRPASDEAEVGGDWFDAFALPNGRVAVSIGDVAGHGLDAAVIMGEVRQAIRTAAVAAESASAVLDYVNRIFMLRQSLGIVTAVFAIYDPVTGELRYACAGHPPPLLALANGPVRALPAGSLPLGCRDELQSREWNFTVPEGAHVVFYTDGLVENDRDLIGGERRLLETARTLLCETAASDEDRADPAFALQERIFRREGNRDDAAVLVLSRTAPVPYYVFSAVPVVAALSRAIVAARLDRIGIEGERRFGILVALGEAVANAIEHAYRDSDPGLIRLELTDEGKHFVLCIEDFGRWRPFVRREERGRGIEMMHAFMDRVQIQSTRNSTRIVLKAELA